MKTLAVLHDVLGASALLPAGVFAAGCVAVAARFSADFGLGLLFAGLALAATLTYPGIVDLHYRLMRNPSGMPPFVLCDAFFVVGETIAIWKLRTKDDIWWIVGGSLVLWIMAGAAARRRAAELQRAEARGGRT